MFDLVLKIFPIIKELKFYSFDKMKGDLMASINVALLDLPQGMAYAMIAGLPYHMGVFASTIASFVGPCFASSRFLMLGPTNAISVMSYATLVSLGFDVGKIVEVMPLLLFMIAVMMTIGSVLKVADLVNYVSRTVVTGYITAAACLIIVKQLKYVFGLEVSPSGTFVLTFMNTIKAMPGVDIIEIFLALFTFAVYSVIIRFSSRLPVVAFTLILMCCVSQVLHSLGVAFHTLADLNVEKVGWFITIPHLNLELMGKLISGALAILFLSLLESSSISKTLAAQSGDIVDPNQQMFSMGIANLGCAFLGGMPISGSLTRSMLNFKSGARTPVSSIMSSILLLVGFCLLRPYIGYIPQSSLATLVVIVGVSLVNLRSLTYALKTTREDAIVFAVTFGCGLTLSLNTAIIFGVVVSLLLFVKRAGNPEFVEYALKDVDGFGKVESPSVALLHVNGNLFFGSSDAFMVQIHKLLWSNSYKAIILRLQNAHSVDATCLMAIEHFCRVAKSRKIEVIITGVGAKVYGLLHDCGISNVVGVENLMRDDPGNPVYATSAAVNRCVELFGRELQLNLYTREPVCS